MSDEGWLVIARRTTRSGLAAMAALCTWVALPGAAWAEGPGELPRYRTAEEAHEVKGTASSADAPSIKPGIYTDTVGRGEKRYYSVALDAKSSSFISAVAAPAPGTKVAAYGDGIKVVLEDHGGTECSRGGDASFQGGGMAYPVADYASRRIGGDVTQCQSAGPYLVSVERVGQATSDPGRWPVEIRFMSEPGLKGSAPAEPGKGSWSSATPAPPTGGSQREAGGGSGFNDARSIHSGVWKDRIKPGETRFYRVPVDWGQQLYASAELPNSPKGDAASGFVPNALGLSTYNPARGRVDGGSFESYDGKQAAVKEFTAPASYGNRFSSGDSSVAAMRFAGWYYLAVSMHADTAQFFTGGTDLTLRIDVKGEPKAGPGYAGNAGNAAKAGFGITPEDQEMAEKGQTSAEAERSDTRQLLAVTGIGAGTVLLLGLGTWTLLARRRVGATGAVAPGPQPQGRPQDQRYGPPAGW